MTLFENLELTDYTESKERREAATLSHTRAKARFAKFLACSTTEEWNARLAMTVDSFREMVKQTCDEVGYNDPEEIFTVVTNHMRMALDVEPQAPGVGQTGPSPSRLKHMVARGKPSEQCTFTGKSPRAGEPWGMLIHDGGGFEYVDPNYIKQNHPEVVDIGQGVTAASFDDGDTYTQDTVDLPSSTDGNLTQPVPEMDKSQAGHEKVIEVPSAQHPTEHQAIDEAGDYSSDLNPSDLGLIDHIDIETPLQPELTKADSTSVFPAGNMAAPVTSAHDPAGHEIQNYDPTESTPGEFQRSDMITHPAAQELVGQDYTPGSLQEWAAQLDKMGLSPEAAWKAITDHFERKTENAYDATAAPEESMGLSNEDLSGMHLQGDKADPSVEDGPHHSSWRLI